MDSAETRPGADLAELTCLHWTSLRRRRRRQERGRALDMMWCGVISLTVRTSV